MAQALENVADCAVLIHNPVLIFADGEYSYRIERRGNQSFYKRDPRNSVSYPTHPLCRRI
jgi:hypothetical protein